MWERADDDELRTWRHTAVDGLVQVIEEAPDSSVAAYPPWTVRDLAVHVVRVFSNARLALRDGSPDAPRPQLTVTSESDPSTLAGAVRDALVAAESELEACRHEQVWAPVGPRPPAFWARRVLREAVLHRWDAEHGRGRASDPSAAVAGELIDEFVDTDVARIVASGVHLAGGAVEIRSDVNTWRVEFATPAVASVDRGPAASISGSPAAVWLWLMRREELPGPVAIDDVGGSVSAFVDLIDAIRRPGGQA